MCGPAHWHPERCELAHGASRSIVPFPLKEGAGGTLQPLLSNESLASFPGVLNARVAGEIEAAGSSADRGTTLCGCHDVSG